MGPPPSGPGLPGEGQAGGRPQGILGRLERGPHPLRPLHRGGGPRAALEGLRERPVEPGRPWNDGRQARRLEKHLRVHSGEKPYR